MSDVAPVQIPVPPNKHLVVLVHGINTNAQWFEIIRRTLESRGYIVAPAGYGIYGVVRFLLPFDWVMRRSAVRVYEKILLAKTFEKPEKISIIAHSFGTYIVSRLLLDHFDFDLHRIVFCGSVVPNDFPFHRIRAQINPPIFNEIGTRDYWPVVAAALTWGYGSVGADGFQSPVVDDRWHAGFRHSDFLTKEFCERYFVPSLAGRKVEGDEPVPFPLWVRLLSRTHFITRPLAALAEVAVLLGALYFGAAYAVRNVPPWHDIANRITRPFQPSLPAPVQWHKLAKGTRFVNRSQSAVSMFSSPNGAVVAYRISIDEVVPKFSSDETWDVATIGQEEWLRLTQSDGRFAYVRKPALELFQN